jgi:hypothetical protein
MPICKNCGRGPKNVILNYKPKAYTICSSSAGCPDELKCSEILDSVCFQYTGNNLLLCNSQTPVVFQFTSLESIFQDLVDLLCSEPDQLSNLNVTINTSETFPSLSASVSGGSGSYTYEWGFAQGPFIGHAINGASNLSILNLDCLGGNAIETGEFNSYIKSSMMYLKVTDANGITKIEYFTYTSDCYNQFVTEPTSGTPAAGRLSFQNETMFGTHLYLPAIDFMDDINNMPTCTELKNYCCPIEYNGEIYSGEAAATLFRENRDTYLKNLNENILAENVGFPEPIFHQPINDTQWMQGDLTDKIIFPTKSGLMLYALPMGCPESTYKAWNELVFPQLDNQTLAQRLPTVDFTLYWIEAVTDPSAPLPVGEPGQLLKYPDPLDPAFYAEGAWDPVTETWSQTLMFCLEDILIPYRERRNAWFKALNQVQLASSPFTWANDYAPFHRWKYEAFGH